MIDEDPMDGIFEDDFRPEDFLEPDQGGPMISANFVEQTFARVSADQARIRDEAARVDDLRLPPELLAAYSPPATASSFVERTLSQVLRQRTDSDAARREMLATYSAPPVSRDFVDRTLDALRVQRAKQPAVRPAARILRGPRRLAKLAPWLAAAAALIVTALLLVSSRGRGDPRPDSAMMALPSVASLQDSTPSSWNTEFARMDDVAEGELRFEAVDPLLLLVAMSGEEDLGE